MTWGVRVSLAPTWLDPAETPGLITPFMILYAVHDALVKPMPGNATLLRIQQLMHERVMFMALLEPAFINGVGPRVAESGLRLISNYLYSAPYEDLKLK